jgi:hypothetical protein
VPHYSENRLTSSPAFWGALGEYPVREMLAVQLKHWKHKNPLRGGAPWRLPGRGSRQPAW